MSNKGPVQYTITVPREVYDYAMDCAKTTNESEFRGSSHDALVAMMESGYRQWREQDRVVERMLGAMRNDG